MTTIAERVASLSARRGIPGVTFTRDPSSSNGYDPVNNTWPDGAGGDWTTNVFAGEPGEIDFQGGTVVARDPILIYVPNVPAVTFAPERGMTFVVAGVKYSVVGVRPYVLDGAAQFWAVLGSG